MTFTKKFRGRQEVLEYLQTLTMSSLMAIAADAILEVQGTTNKIVITEEQFNAFFRIRGYKENGEKETRGRMKKDPELDLNAE